MSASSADDITLTNTVPGTIVVRRGVGSLWRISQRKAPPGHDSNQVVTWIRIDNPGKAAEIAVEVKWASPAWMPYRRFGYVRTRGKYRVVTGEERYDRTRYEFTAPHGASHFGPTPWYANEDALRFVRGMCRRHESCKTDVLGQSGEGRDITRLKIEAPGGKRRKSNVLVLGREHATESAGSFAVETVTKYLLSDEAPKAFLRDYVFHMIPVINPDGVANGRKLTCPGPVKERDIYQAALHSDDPTCRVLRETVFALEPACIVSYHSYLQPTPACMFFDKDDGMAMLDMLLNEDNWIRAMGPVFWPIPKVVKSVWHVNRMPADWTLWGHCYSKFGSVINMPELPWHGRTMAEMERIALVSFLASMRALEARRKRE